MIYGRKNTPVYKEIRTTKVVDQVLFSPLWGKANEYSNLFKQWTRRNYLDDTKDLFKPWNVTGNRLHVKDTKANYFTCQIWAISKCSPTLKVLAPNSRLQMRYLAKTCPNINKNNFISYRQTTCSSAIEDKTQRCYCS